MTQQMDSKLVCTHPGLGVSETILAQAEHAKSWPPPPFGRRARTQGAMAQVHPWNDEAKLKASDNAVDDAADPPKSIEGLSRIVRRMDTWARGREKDDAEVDIMADEGLSLEASTWESVMLVSVDNGLGSCCRPSRRPSPSYSSS
mmetsp:Transcript_20145/g.65077  ORF Transcript_20145/g.65077 Transcript_20145/m.65077 type:complete len:145 (+) Transcript_20145:3-437(+)